jgi:hypothetical protein
LDAASALDDERECPPALARALECAKRSSVVILPDGEVAAGPRAQPSVI